MTNHVEEERWRPVVGYEGLYEASNIGRIRSVERINYYGSRQLRSVMLSFSVNTAGGRQGARYTVKLSKNGRLKVHQVHRLVAIAWIPNPKELTDVCHKDHNPLNNRIENLEWMTHKENITVSVEAGRWRRKVSDETIVAIRQRAAAGESQRSLAKEYGVAFGTVNSIVNRRSWKHLL